MFISNTLVNLLAGTEPPPRHYCCLVSLPTNLLPMSCH